MNRRGFLSAFGKAVVAGPIAVTQIGKPEVAATIEDGAVVLKPGTYRSLVVKDCTFNPLPGETAVEISDIVARTSENAYGFLIRNVDARASSEREIVLGGRHAIDEEPL